MKVSAESLVLRLVLKLRVVCVCVCFVSFFFVGWLWDCLFSFGLLGLDCWIAFGNLQNNMNMFVPITSEGSRGAVAFQGRAALGTKRVRGVGCRA